MKRYRIKIQKVGQFGNKSIAYTIEKKTWLGFYWGTNDYFLSYNAASKYCNSLNNKR